MDSLQAWVGRSVTVDDRVTSAPVGALTATLDRDDPPTAHGQTIPPLWHWLYFLPTVRQSGIGLDGHPQRGGFLPPVPLPRRMWAGSQLEFVAPLGVGQTISRTSRIDHVQLKDGRGGPLVFVHVQHDVSAGGRTAIVERQDIVYRQAARTGDAPPAGTPAPTGAAWMRRIEPDPVLLFRYSALTLNGHRIHYDRPYACDVEGYPGLVVHGPLIATLLLDLLRRERPEAQVTGFRFKAMTPLFDTAPFEVCGRPGDDGTVRLWARTPEGTLAMDATATLA